MIYINIIYKKPFKILSILITLSILLAIFSSNKVSAQGANTLLYPPDSEFTRIPTNNNVSYPDYLESVIDPEFKTRITRVSDRANHYVSHNYPKIQSWNFDQTMMRLNNSVVDAKTLEEIVFIDGQIHEIKWSSTNPKVLFGIKHLYKDDDDGSNVNDDFIFYKMTVNSRSIDYTELIRFSKTDYQKVLIGPWEGNIDYFDHYVAFSANKIGKNYLTVIIYDIKNDTTIVKDFENIRWRTDTNEQVLDWVSVSPLGQYVLIIWRVDPNAEADSRDTVEQYDIELNFIRQLSTRSGHGDIGVNEGEQEVYVQFEYGRRNGIWGYNLVTGVATRLLPDKYNGGHISCRNYKRYGWCYPSTHAEGYREVFALKLDDTETVERFAQTRATNGNPFGGASPDGTKVFFRSDWNGQTASGKYESFIVEINK